MRGYDDREICRQLKRGIIPKALDYGYVPCASAFEECRVKQNSFQPKSPVERLVDELMYGSYVPDSSVYTVDTDSEDEYAPPKADPPPTESIYVQLRRYMICL